MAINVIFDQTIQGSATVGTELWVDLGAIPVDIQELLGSTTFTAQDKTVTCEVRTNTTGQSAGTLGATSLMAQVTVRSGRTADNDWYQNGNLFTATVVGTGSEHWWLRLTGKSGDGVLDYTLRYTEY